MPGLNVAMPETNLVYIDTEAAGMPAQELAARARAQGVLISVMGRFRARACTHLDVGSGDMDDAVAVLRQAAAA